MVKEITVNSYFSMFDVLKSELKETTEIDGKKNVVFCEEKISLMTERIICSEFKGSFNTDVYSFGNFLRAKRKCEKVLSKEGSSMAIRKILSGLTLTALKTNKRSVAPSLFELFIQLKSAGISAKELQNSVEYTDGILKSKLLDICTVYYSYEEFIEKEGYLDQSSFLSKLPEVLSGEDFSNTDVYILGFTNGFTKQLKDSVGKLIKTAKNVTGIFVKGDNPFVFLNETARSFIKICKDNGESCSVITKDGDFNQEGKIFIEGLFNPIYNKERFSTDKISLLSAKNKREEVLRIAETIRRKVNGGARYRDFSVGISVEDYSDEIEDVFSNLNIPFFLDKKKRAESHPLISLIVSYCDVFRKNFKRDILTQFIKNPIISDNKEFADRFIDYLIKYGVDYSKIKEPFVFGKEQEDFNRFEEFRKKILSYFDRFSVRELIKKTDAEEKLKEFSVKLSDLGYVNEKGVNDQTFEAVNGILSEMELLLGDSDITEYKKVFLSGVSGLELSIIPQYNDAVFIGDFKEVALAKAKFLFLAGLNSSVPNVKEDVSLLTDADLYRLENLSLKIEPTIRVVNDRTRENVAMACASFTDELYLSYSVADTNGKLNERSEILNFATERFTTREFPELDGYLTLKEGLRSFAVDCGKYVNGSLSDFTTASSFRETVDYSLTDNILNHANKTLAKRVDNANKLYGEETSPTVIENFYRCPYKAFLEHGIKLKKKEIGEVDNLVVGTIMHEVFKTYAENLNLIKDRKTSDELVEKEKVKLLKKDDISRYGNSPRGEYMLNSLFSECSDFCYKTYSSLKNSKFLPSKLEVSFGKGKDLSPIELCGGKLSLKGKIDRVDSYGEYYRIIDYKTGSADWKDEDLFCGKKLQLFLYAAAICGEKLAGAYYFKAQENFKTGEKAKKPLFSGKTLDCKEIVEAQDGDLLLNGQSDILPVKIEGDKVLGGSNKESLDAYVKYAVKLCEKGAKAMIDGEITPSPLIKTCSYCEFSAICGNDGKVRNLGNVSEETIVDAVKGDNNA